MSSPASEFFEAVFPGPGLHPEQGLVWHYTNSEALLCILSTDALHASSAEHMNDRREVAFGRDVLREAFERAISQGVAPVETTRRAVDDFMQCAAAFGSTFLVCASTDGDSLSQWRAYGGTTPYAIGFDSSFPLAILGSPSMQQGHRGFDGRFMALNWRLVNYDSVATADRFTQGFIELHEGNMAERGKSLVPLELSFCAYMYRNIAYLAKDPRFADEREVRILVNVPDGVSALQLRASRFGITPYVRLTGSDHPREPGWDRLLVREDAGKLPIREIRIGPVADQAAHALGLRTALDHYGYPEVSISASDISVR